MTKRRVAIVHSILAAGNGGSEARAMWAAEALKRQFAVSVISPGPVYLDRLNAFYGTRIRPEHVQIAAYTFRDYLNHGVRLRHYKVPLRRER